MERAFVLFLALASIAPAAEPTSDINSPCSPAHSALDCAVLATENGREAKYYAITKAGLKALGEETQRWRQLSGLVETLLGEES